MSIMQAKLKNIATHDLTKTISLIIIALISFIAINQFINISHNLALIIIQQVILVIPVLYFISKKNITLTTLGFKKANLIKTILSVIGAFLTFILISGSIHYFQQLINFNIPGYSVQKSYTPIFENMNLYTIILVAGILVPIVEEILFRGLIFHQIKSSTKIKIITSAIIFATFHLQFEVFIPLVILGIILGYLRISQNSIIAPIVFHITNNIFAIYASFFLLPA